MKKRWDHLIKLFLEENKKINLSAIKDYNQVYIKHILDSLYLTKVINLPSKSSIVDVGTGSGFPILPLSIENKNCTFLGIESKKKKVLAVNNIIKKLCLENVKIIWSRAEVYKKTQFDFVIARAVAYIDKLINFSYHLAKKGGYFVFYKINSYEKYKYLLHICKKKQLKLENIYQYKLFDQDIKRVLYVIKKL